VKKLNQTEQFPYLFSLPFQYDNEWHTYRMQFESSSNILSIYRDNLILSASLFTFPNMKEASLKVGGFFQIRPDQTPKIYSYLPAYISSINIYNSAIVADSIHSQLIVPSCSSPGEVMYGGVCRSMSCSISGMVLDSNKCICPYGEYLNLFGKCSYCPFDSTVGSILPRTSIKDCQCIDNYIYSERQSQCVEAQPAYYPPVATFNFVTGYGPDAQLEKYIISQRYFPVGEMSITLAPPNNQSSEVDGWEYYVVKLIFNGTQILWTKSLNEHELLDFIYFANETGDYDLVLSTECDSHRAGITSKTSFHIRKRDLKPLIIPKPTDGVFDSPFQVKMLQPYRDKPSVVILCYGRDENNVTCVEYDDKKTYIFGPPVYLKLFCYGTYFTRLPGEIIHYYYPRTITPQQQAYLDNQKEWNDYLTKKELAIKEAEQRKNSSPLYQVFNPFVDWFNTYPNYLWFPIVAFVALVLYLIFLLIIRFFIARRINKLRRSKVKKYLKEQKKLNSYLNQFLPPPMREDNKPTEIDQTGYPSVDAVPPSTSVPQLVLMNGIRSPGQSASTRTLPTPPTSPLGRSVKSHLQAASTMIQEDDIEIELQDHGSINLPTRSNGDSHVTSTKQVTRTPPTPPATLQHRKHGKGPKYLLCGQCGDMARFWCIGCDNYLCVQCCSKDAPSHDGLRSKVMVCDHCMQSRAELREHFLKGTYFKLYGCKPCLDDLYKQRRVNRVGAVLKRCQQCLDEEISRTQPESKLCSNCIFLQSLKH